MKRITTLFTAISIASLALGANEIEVYLKPSIDSQQIGTLETMSLAVPAEWPDSETPQSNWKPVYYNGVFDVYVDNNAIAKDLSVKPGSRYYLQPDADTEPLAIATKQDTTDILSVDTWYCKLQLETIVVGYIQSGSIEANQIVSNLSPQTNQAKPVTSTGKAVTEIVGRLEKAGLVGRNRTGLAYKVMGAEGRPLAFVDFENLPDRINLDDFVGINVRVSGFLEQSESGKDVLLTAKTIQKAH